MANLIMTPREHDIIETTMGLVNAILSRVKLVMEIRVVDKGFGVDDFIRKFATDDYGISVSDADKPRNGVNYQKYPAHE